MHLATPALLATILIPPVVYVALRTSSMSAGLVAVALMYCAWCAASGTMLRPTKRLLACAIVSLSALIVVFTLGTISFFVAGSFDISRFLASFLLLAAVMGAAFALARFACDWDNTTTDKAVKFAFYVLLVSGFASVLGYSPMAGNGVESSVSFFYERSHFAITFLPFLLHVVIRSERKLLWIFCGVALALGLVNLTLLVGMILISLLTLRKRHLLLLLSLAGLAAWAAIGLVDPTYYVDRINLSADSENLSTLAFLQGWERAYLNLRETQGLGIGFQQFGIVGDMGGIQDDIEAIAGKPLNVYDGSTVGSKLVAEFGLVGIVMLIAYVMTYFRQMQWLRHASRFGHADSRDIFFRSWLAMYAIDLFVRGTGYFDANGFLFIASLYWLTLSSPSCRTSSSRQ